MAWTQVNKTVYHSTAAGTNFTPTFPAATAGNLLIACVQADGVINVFTAGWTMAAQSIVFTDMRLYYKIAAGGEASINMQLGTPRSAQATIFEYSGNVSVSPLDLANAQDGNSTTFTTATLNTTNANDLLICQMGSDQGGVLSALSAGWTQESNDTTTGAGGSGTDDYQMVGSRIVSATGSYFATCNSDLGTVYMSCIAAFKMATVSAASPPPVRRDYTHLLVR